MIRAGILGASGYVGAELVRLLATHPQIAVAALGANARAGQPMAKVFPHLRHLDLPPLVTLEAMAVESLDILFSALPHATSQEIVKALPGHLKVVDTSADFRLRDTAAYERWYGHPHRAPELQAEAVYGLPEFHREAIRRARLVAATGCNAAAGNFAVLPLLEAGVIEADEIVIDLKAGVSGAGRKAAEAMLHAEVSEGIHAYTLDRHRHLAEFEQEFSRAAGRSMDDPVSPTFTAHLAPQNRGILASVYVHGAPERVHAALATRYAHEPFVQVLPFGEVPATRHVRGANFVHLGVAPQRRAGRAIVVSALDNLVKGAAGMGVQCANLMLGLDETAGLMAPPLFP